MKTLKVQRRFFDEDLVEDVEIELRQAQDSARIYSDILSGTMDAYASVMLQQPEHRDETDDIHLDRIDATDLDCQPVRDECPELLGGKPLWIFRL